MTCVALGCGLAAADVVHHGGLKQRPRGWGGVPTNAAFSFLWNQPSSPRGVQIAAIYRNKGKLIKINDSNLNGALFRIKSPAGALAVYVQVFVFGNQGSAGTR